MNLVLVPGGAAGKPFLKLNLGFIFGKMLGMTETIVAGALSASVARIRTTSEDGKEKNH